MASGKFLQIHTLTSYPGTLLNRDDAGFAKRLPFGGATRTRVSSQCLKYHWRNFDGEHALYEMDVPKSLRSRETFRRRVAEPLIDAGYPPTLVGAMTVTLRELVLSGKVPTEKVVTGQLELSQGEDGLEGLESSQITIFGEPEMKYLRDLAAKTLDAVKEQFPVFWDDDGEPSDEELAGAAEIVRDVSQGDLKKNLKGLRLASGLDAAMFGRMATSDVLARGDAAVHVAHAFTTHEEQSESDYFSAVDELRRDEPGESGELGAGHINSSELTSGLFYGYVVIDVPLLVSNVEGVPRADWRDADRELAAGVVQRFVHLIATVSPGAKLGSTAPHAYSQCVLVESGAAQPRTFANAFQKPVPAGGDGVLANSYGALARFVEQLDGMYGRATERRLAAMDADGEFTAACGVSEIESLSAVAEWAGNEVRS